ncbi:hypothetical protein Gasu2_06260 [Galdieria sulphuraria]|uniref:Uncharacterized protein n=1 Tax=Galdieria sulphuraria TaxID=130081 RepID=M2W2R2_GALSU|nr:uncharacterized protein Gasu_25750 [Galdieria sulphuraria]EME29986.1 hypothetical protein Gasu_25750 [Galdieria sulphuraria]GJD06198.1 hypothetical protein Gasu2_06260 [Galdieria sulphuraria]|eukprot:XP_005706506.1 hypothetical protein Gasu_25750 [Galdieria sulphuraria]
MVNWWQSVLYGRRFSDRNIEKLEHIESEIQNVELQVKSILESLGIVSRNCTKGQVLVSCLFASSLFLTIAYSGVLLFRRASLLFIISLILIYLFRRVYVSWIGYNVRRCRLKLAKLKTRKVHLLEDLKQKNDFYKVFDVLKRFDENYKSQQDIPDIRQSSKLEEESMSSVSETKVQKVQDSKSASVSNTPEKVQHSISTEISRSYSSQGGSNNTIDEYFGSSSRNPTQQDIFKRQKREKVDLTEIERQTNSFHSILQSWLGSLIHWIVYSLSGEHNIQLEEQLELLRETLELEKVKRKKLEAELRRILSNQHSVGSENTSEILNDATSNENSNMDTNLACL